MRGTRTASLDQLLFRLNVLTEIMKVIKCHKIYKSFSLAQTQFSSQITNDLCEFPAVKWNINHLLTTLCH